MFNREFNFEYNELTTNVYFNTTTKEKDTTTTLKFELKIEFSNVTTETTISNVDFINRLPAFSITSNTVDTITRVQTYAVIVKYINDLQIFNPSDERLAYLSNVADNACHYWDAIFREELNRGSEFSFVTNGNHEDSEHIKVDNQVAFMDKDMNFRLFVIKETEEIDGENGIEIHAYCEPSMLELNDVIIEDKRPQNRTAEYALGQALENSRWQIGNVAELGEFTTNFYYMTATESLMRILDVWGGEFVDRIEFDDAGITGRYIDILTRRGADTGKRWEIDKDIERIERETQSYIKTALYGRGASLETEDGGYSRKLTFADVEWKTSNGNPVDKPLGQEWVGDDDALLEHGIDDNGVLTHRFGIFENGNIEDEEELLKETWKELQKQKRSVVNYAMDVILLEEVIGYEHEKVRLGDSTIAIDRRFGKPIEVEERVIVFEYDVSEPDNSGKVELGDYIDLYEDDKRISQMQAQLDNAQGKANHPEINDDSFPDDVPPIPTNFTADGRFETIALSWDYDPSSYIASYEIYASEIQGFTPSSANLIWRGKSGGHVFNADVNEQWYFRIRAVNTHGTASAYSDEEVANTLQINANTQIEKETITNQLIAANAAIDFAKISNVEITDAMIVSLLADKIQGGTLTLGGVNDSDGVFKLRDGNENTIITGDKDGFQLADGATIMGEFGVMSVLSSESISDNVQLGQGWGAIGHQGAEHGPTGWSLGSIYVHIDIPTNFKIEKATLYIFAMPVNYINNVDNVNKWVRAREIRVYKISNAYKGYYRYVTESGDFGMAYTTGDDISGDVLGASSWTPSLTPSSQPEIKLKKGDVTNHISTGLNTFQVGGNYFNSNDYSATLGLGKLFLTVEGYLKE